ncbi:hypothetical protein [Colwellia psychrerythraea]|nr:hypothetical protein [Colwellia psychrerythraea]
MTKSIIFMIFSIFSTTSFAVTKIPFFWESFESFGVTYEKGAMLIAVAGKKDKFLQLDTGATDSYAYGTEVSKTINFNSLNKTTQTHSFKAMPKMETDRVIGTLGTDYFKNQCLTVDFPNQMLIVDNCDDTNKLEISWLESYRFKTGHLMVKVNSGEQTFHNIVLDTGSSIFPLTLTKKNWLKVVSPEDAKNPPYKIKVSAWGKEIVLKGALPVQPICIGSSCSSKAIYIDQTPGLEGAGIEGIAGNALFYDSHMIIFNFKNDTVGTLKSISNKKA